MNKDKIEVLNTIAANNGHKDWLELIHCVGPITVLNYTIEAMELYAQSAQLQQHGVVRGGDLENQFANHVGKYFEYKNVDTTPNTQTEPLPAEGSAKSVSDGKVINMQKHNEQEIYKRILKRGEPSA